ncbi:cell division protein FtsL [Granulicella sp. WH15]|uniref:cell division protein FtsL n=1 Tax=Granulicella sp. WH15 TaxID=2602070 RepID=UPI00136724A1|nr:cell division protein FtsL [Granulicella sp. WH15]QHN04457.1 cell division protein FtsL [Granulicella sp. WH15]
MAAIATGLDMTSAGRATRRRPETVAERNRELFEQQRRARRGPTPEVFFAKHLDNSRIVKLDDPERRKEMRSFAVMMSILFALVMIFVWQHFSAIEMGYQIEAQKQQVETMREQNRQLRLTEAQLSDPGRLDRMARQLGLDEPQPGQVVRPEGSMAAAVAQINTPGVPQRN